MNTKKSKILDMLRVNKKKSENIMYYKNPSLKYRQNNRDKLNETARQKYQQKKANFIKKGISLQGHKLCSGCKKELPITAFSKSYSSVDGMTYTCQKCIRARNNTKHNLLKKMLRGAKERSLQNNLNFNLDFDFLVQISNIKNCPVFGIPLEWEINPDKKDVHKNKNNRPSLDRINSQHGYTKDNVKIISWRANKLKNESTIKELLEIINYMKKHLNDISYGET